jgi:hypothetical protein
MRTKVRVSNDFNIQICQFYDSLVVSELLMSDVFTTNLYVVHTLT